MATDTNGVQYRQVALCCRGHTRPVVDVYYSKIKREDKFFFITASKDRQAMLYQGDTGDWIGTFEGHKGAVWGACLNSNATQAATGAADFTAKLWNAVSGDEIATFRHKHIVKAVDFSQDNSHLITGCNDKVIRLFNLGNPDSEPQLFQEHKEAIKCAVWAGDQNYFVSAEEIAQIKLWDVRTGSVVKTIDLTGPVFSVELSCDRSLLTVAHKNGVSFLDATSMEIIKSHNSANQVFSASLHPQKSCFVAGGAEDTSGKGEGFKVYKFAFEDGQELESYKGHFGPVHCVRYNPDGEVYCSASEDGTVRLWQHTVGKTYGLWKNPQEDPTAAAQ